MSINTSFKEIWVLSPQKFFLEAFISGVLNNPCNIKTVKTLQVWIFACLFLLWLFSDYLAGPIVQIW